MASNKRKKQGDKDRKAELDELATEIRKGHAKVVSSLRTSLDAARETGELLNTAKGRVPRGRWTTFLADNCHVGEQEAQRYMRIAKNWERLVAATGDPSALTLSEALKIFAKPSAADATSHQDASTGEPIAAKFTVSEDEFDSRREQAGALRVDTLRFEPDSNERKAVSRLIGGMLNAVRRNAVQLGGQDRDPVVVAILLVNEIKKGLDPTLLRIAEKTETVKSPSETVAATPSPENGTPKASTRRKLTTGAAS